MRRMSSRTSICKQRSGNDQSGCKAKATLASGGGAIVDGPQVGRLRPTQEGLLAKWASQTGDALIDIDQTTNDDGSAT